ncbi:MAG: 5-dehydro-4-deoxy-D-glucuronate isomerase [Bacteroidales bacterium]|jgi:4-deoxy-L-threo-5-hexosulose-uronate ketol-isomerase|nr:5-dehydro-4-deoxy-D-glucuronate isomerase [Bacteroidales bacterium]MBP5420175.1 5-dehydro-4-deoxy-D-glucuronate isomerase [Bacteroidales bacterium]
MNYELRYASHPEDAKHYDTTRLRKEFLIEKLFIADDFSMVYSLYDRYIVGGLMPVNKVMNLNDANVSDLKANFFLERREFGLINVGGACKITADGETFEINYKEMLYIGRGKQNVTFESLDKNKPAKLYFNSAPAHKEYPCKKITKNEADVLTLGSLEGSNDRTINRMIINSVVPTCQLQMGMTELKPGSVWNTMPAHVHNRRMEAYFYFEVPEDQAVCHFMGPIDETRHIWMHNEQAVLSPSWSIHSAAATSNYTFIWGMAGENLDYSDQDFSKITDLK